MAIRESRELILFSMFLNNPSAVLHAVLGSSAQERAHGVGLEESYKRGQRAGAPLLQRNSERFGIVLGEKKTKERHYCSLSLYKESL